MLSFTVQAEKTMSVTDEISIKELSIHKLGAGGLTLELDYGSATISALAVRDQNLLVGKCGYVAVEDRTTGKFHFKPEQKSAVETTPDQTSGFRQTDSVANLALTQQFIPKEDWIEWSVQVETDSKDIREIHLHFVLPVFGAESHGFMAHAQCPMIPGTGNDHRMVVYGPDMTIAWWSMGQICLTRNVFITLSFRW